MIWYITWEIFTQFLRVGFLWAVIQKNVSLLNGIVFLFMLTLFFPFMMIAFLECGSIFLIVIFSLVSAQTLKSNLDSMNHQIQRLENDIKNFPKTQDENDKFVEKMSISFLRVFVGELNILIAWISIYSTWK